MQFAILPFALVPFRIGAAMVEKIKLPLIKNKKALRDYEILEKLEAGIALLGSEIKACRAGMAELSDAYVEIINGEAWLFNSHISPYEKAGYFNHETKRKRRLLLHARELHRWEQKVKERGLTIVPLDMHFKGALLKVDIALVRGRSSVDKRNVLAEKEAKREMDRAIKSALKK